MMGSGVRARLAVLVGLVVGVLSWLMWRFYADTGNLVPRPPALALALLAVMAAFVAAWAWPVRRYLRGDATRPLDPLRAARTVVLSQAAALTGSAAAGWYAGQLAVVLGRLDLVANRDRILPLSLATLVALVLAAAGLLGQRWCRIEPPRDDDDRDR